MFESVKAILDNHAKGIEEDQRRMFGALAGIEALTKEGRTALNGDISVDHLKRIFDDIEKGVWVARGDI